MDWLARRLRSLGHQQAEIVLTVLKFFRVKGEVRVPGGADDAGLLHLVFSKEGRGPLTEDGLQAEKAAPGAGQEKQRGSEVGRGIKPREVLPLLLRSRAVIYSALLSRWGVGWRWPTIWGERMGRTTE